MIDSKQFNIDLIDNEIYSEMLLSSGNDGIIINIILFGVGIGVVLTLLIELIIFGIYKLIDYIRYRRWPYDYGK